MIMQLPHQTSPRRTLWSWLCDTVLPLDRDSAPTMARLPEGGAEGLRDVVANDAVILPFPIHGEALLVKLAAVLRERVGEGRAQQDPLELSIERKPLMRLVIDQAAYVEFQNDRGVYHAVIEAAIDTTVRLDTTDFDTLVRFVMQYVAERPADTATLEAAS